MEKKKYGTFVSEEKFQQIVRIQHKKINTMTEI